MVLGVLTAVGVGAQHTLPGDGVPGARAQRIPSPRMEGLRDGGVGRGDQVAGTPVTPGSVRLGCVALGKTLPVSGPQFLQQRLALWSSRHGSVEMNPTRNHEDAGSIPGLAQWVKDPALL